MSVGISLAFPVVIRSLASDLCDLTEITFHTKRRSGFVVRGAALGVEIPAALDFQKLQDLSPVDLQWDKANLNIKMHLAKLRIAQDSVKFFRRGS